MNAIILKVKPNSMLRLGSGSKDEVDMIIHSDTLFSAIVNIHSLVYDNTDEFIRVFDEGKIKISSAFPLLMNQDEKERIYFLPKPELNYTSTGDVKTEKKIKFISLKSYEHLLVRISPDQTNKINFSEKSLFQFIGSSFLVTKEEIDIPQEITSFISEEVTPKTKVHSMSQEDSFYHETNIQFTPINIGDEENKKIMFPHFYFLYEINTGEKTKNEFLTCIRILADEGIGGERSAGKGQFEEIILTELTPLPNNHSDKSLLLSLCNPKSQEEFAYFDRYEIVIRGGGSVSGEPENEEEETAQEYSDYRKKQVRMIAEGAVINGKVEGRLVDISPAKGAEHQVYRNGKCFTIPLG